MPVYIESEKQWMDWKYALLRWRLTAYNYEKVHKRLIYITEKLQYLSNIVKKR